MPKATFKKPLQVDQAFEGALQKLSDRGGASQQPAVQDVEVVRYPLPGREEVELLLDKTGETLWATQSAIGILFNRDANTIGEHIGNIYSEHEVEEAATTRKFRVVRTEGGRDVNRAISHYNLDLILSVGYRTSSREATEFRKWATGVLKAYLVQGYALNEGRLRDDSESLRGLAADVRALRSGEKQIYEAVRDCFKLSSTDYEPNSKHTKTFYAKLQDKFLVATTGKTASQIVLERADSEKDDMGLTHMRGDFPDLWDAKVGKNYLIGDELYALHILCEQFLLFAESKALRGQKLTMAEMAAKFDELLAVQGHTVFTEYKDYLEKKAHDHAKQELEAYKARVGYLPKPRSPRKLAAAATNPS